MIVALLVLVAILTVLSVCRSVLLYSVLLTLRAGQTDSNTLQAASYQRAVTTPKPKDVPGRPVNKDADGNIDFADLDFETGYAALAAHGKGEN